MANPTTNYGFVLPTSTDLVTDLPADFDVALQGVDTRLKALQPGTTLGDIAYSSATANTNTRLGIGSTGNVLTVAGGVPTWAAPAASGGKVLQVVSTTYSTAINVASTTYTDIGLTLSITPTLASSKVLVIANIATQAEGFSSATNVGLGVRLVRGATTVFTQDPIRQSTLLYAAGVGGAGLIDRKVTTITYLDNPATTSSTAYKIQGASETATGTNQAAFQASSAVSVITLLEIGA